MINLLFRHSLFSQRYSFRLHLVPAQPLGGGLRIFNTINLPSCANQGVAIDKLHTKPGHKATLINGIQPQRYLCQLHRNRVQVNAVNIAIGNIHFYLLQLVEAIFISDDLAGFFFLAGNIRFGQLIDGFIQEGCGAHSRLADGQFEDFIRSLALKKFFQGILHQALCQNLRRVVGCGLFPLSAGQAIDESAFLIHTELAFFLAGLIADTFVFIILLQLAFGDKVTYIQLIERVALTLDFIQILLCNKATVGQQCFVDCAHLVDAQIRIGNTTTAAIFSARSSCQTHQVNDTQHTAIAQLRCSNHLGIFRVKDMCLQRSNQEHIMQAVVACCFFQLIFCFRIAVINQFIELCQRLMQIVTVTDFINIITNVIGDIPQARQRITGVIALRFDRCIAKFRSGLDEEDKQHTIHIAQALQRQLTGIHRICFQVTAKTRFHIIEDFISKQLNTLTKCIFQILRNAGSVFLALLIQFIEQNFSVIRAERVPVQKNRHCLQGCIFHA